MEIDAWDVNRGDPLNIQRCHDVLALPPFDKERCVGFRRQLRNERLQDCREFLQAADYMCATALRLRQSTATAENAVEIYRYILLHTRHSQQRRAPDASKQEVLCCCLGLSSKFFEEFRPLTRRKLSVHAGRSEWFALEGHIMSICEWSIDFRPQSLNTFLELQLATLARYPLAQAVFPATDKPRVWLVLQRVSHAVLLSLDDIKRQETPITVLAASVLAASCNFLSVFLEPETFSELVSLLAHTCPLVTRGAMKPLVVAQAIRALATSLSELIMNSNGSNNNYSRTTDSGTNR